MNPELSPEQATKSTGEVFVFLWYRVNKVRGNLFQIFPMKFCPPTGRFKIGHFALKVKIGKCSE